ncbi:MAG: carboxypeptidase regulatory-like domain-containing protein [Terracidiphilus sp.]
MPEFAVDDDLRAAKLSGETGYRNRLPIRGAGQIGVKVQLQGERSGSQGQGLETGLLLLLVMFFGCCGRVWTQPGGKPVSTTGAESSLPEGPTPQISAEPAGSVGLVNSAGPVGSFGQEPPGPVSTGSVQGVVVDREGTVCEGANVELDQAGAGGRLVRTATSDSAGRFSFPNVLPGNFRIAVSSKGFETKVVQGLLHAGETFDAQTIVLPVTSTSEVTVTATQVEIAAEQVKIEEQQRVLGVIPNFYVSYVRNAAPLTTRQKYDLAWKSSIDPVTFIATGFFAGVEQAENTFSGYGQGAEGYAKRFGANYADGFINTMLGSAVLASWWKQDPRYFYKGTGTIHARALYAIANAVICKGDNGKWQPNYSSIVGGLAAGGVSNLYYPASDRDGVSLTLENALVSTGEGAVENLIQEFIIRKLTPKIPNYGTGNP